MDHRGRARAASTLARVTQTKKWPRGTKLSEAHPNIAREWHPTLNGKLTPADVTRANPYLHIWWLGAKCGHTWHMTTAARTGKKPQGCAVCRGLQIQVGVNDLFTVHPEVATDWAYELNDGAPEQFTRGNKTKVWWRGAVCGHVWESRINDRCVTGTGCHYCSGYRVLTGFNDLATTHPELAAEWSTRNGDLTPAQVSFGYAKKVWWTSAECGHTWEAAPNSRTNVGSGCGQCRTNKVIPGVNSLDVTHPHLAAEWHSELNGVLTPSDVRYGTKKVAWWVADCGHTWDAWINGRGCHGFGCPYCSGVRLLAGLNDLATLSPNVARQWHPSKNDLGPHEVTNGAARVAWWLGDCGHAWDMPVTARTTQGQGCPYWVCPIS